MNIERDCESAKEKERDYEKGFEEQFKRKQ